MEKYGDIDREEYSSRKKKLVNEKIAVENRMKAIVSGGVMYWLEPLKEFVNAVWKRNLETAVGDLVKLRDFFAEGGSNLCIGSRKVLWDWNLPYSLLAERGICSDWWARWDSNPQGLLQRILSPSRIPVPPLAHKLLILACIPSASWRTLTFRTCPVKNYWWTRQDSNL